MTFRSCNIIPNKTPQHPQIQHKKIITGTYLQPLGLPGGLSIRCSLVSACPTLPKVGCCGAGLVNGEAYAPGIGTEAYVCSPGAAATCSILRSTGGDAARGSKPSCCVLGVADWTLIGGAWRANGLTLRVAFDCASTNRVPTNPSSAEGALL